MKKKALAAMILAVSVVSLSGCSMLEKAYFLKNTLETAKRDTDTDVSVDVDVEYEPDGLMDEYEAYAYEEMPMGVSGNMMYAAGKAAYMPQSGGEYAPIDWNTEEYKYMEENGWLSPETAPFSTFAADVDTASYANVRRMLLEGREVPADAVRIEEMINYFDYDYPQAKGDEPFSVTTRIAPCPWNEDTRLMMIGLKAKEVPAKERTASNLVFLVDVSGSMDEYNKLPLVQRAFRLLINELDENDTVSLVTYASGDDIVLDGVPGSEKTQICDAIEDLLAGGGTNGSQGIISAYKIAEDHFIEGGNNRVILATDGDLNIGMTDEGSLTRLIEEKAKSGVYLSVLGFGEGNISDTNMEALADHGNGNYSYIDSIGEARKVLIEEAGSTLFTVARDVKLQVEFNPDRVKGYRLIGYENRTMAAEDFADDTKDGGEIGSGHTVTVLYEIADDDADFEPNKVESRYRSDEGKMEAATENDAEETDEATTGTDAEEIDEADPYANEWGILHIRYKEPDGEESMQLDYIIDDDCVIDELDDDLSWAAGVAQAGMILGQSDYAGTTDLSEVRDRLKALTGNDEFREEFVYLLTRM